MVSKFNKGDRNRNYIYRNEKSTPIKKNRHSYKSGSSNWGKLRWGDDRLRFVRHRGGESEIEGKEIINIKRVPDFWGLLKMRRFMIAMDSIESEEKERL